MLYKIYPSSYRDELLTFVDIVEEEVYSHLGYYVVAFRMKITDGRPWSAGNTDHQDGIWSVTSSMRGCDTYESVKSSIFVSTEEEHIRLFPWLQVLLLHTNIDWFRNINTLFYHVHVSRQWMLLAQIYFHFCCRLFIFVVFPY